MRNDCIHPNRCLILLATTHAHTRRACVCGGYFQAVCAFVRLFVKFAAVCCTDCCSVWQGSVSRRKVSPPATRALCRPPVFLQFLQQVRSATCAGDVVFLSSHVHPMRDACWPPASISYILESGDGAAATQLRSECWVRWHKTGHKSIQHAWVIWGR